MTQSDEFEVDTSLTPKQRLEEYIRSNSEFRLVHCTECVVDCINSSDPDEFNYLNSVLMGYIHELLEHEIPTVSDSMLLMLPDFVDTLYKYFSEEAETILSLKILPLMHSVIDKESEQFAESYAALIIKLRNETFIMFEVPFLKQLVSDHEPFRRLTVATVIGYLIEYISPSIWWNDLMDLLSKLTTDLDEEIRSMVPPLVALYCQKTNVPKEKAQLSGKFSLYCRDSSIIVRRAAAESIVALSEALDLTSKLITVSPAVNTLLADPSDIVRDVTTKNLGPLISSLGKITTPILIAKYCTALSSQDVNVAFSAAFSFSAVSLALGSSRFHEIKSAFDNAAGSREYRIRRTLSYSFVKYAHFFTKEEVLDIAINFLKDHSMVAIGILSNLHEILKIVDKGEPFYKYIKAPRIYKEWRMRYQIAQQIRYCKEFFKRSKLIKIAYHLIQDSIWKVRKEAAISYAELMIVDDIPNLESLSQSMEYYKRAIVGDVISQTKIGSWENYGFLKNLYDDPVPNVRVTAAKAIASLFKTKDHSIANIVDKLKTDPDLDVRQAILSYK